MFPASNRSSSVIVALRQAARSSGVQLLPKRALQGVKPLEGRGFELQARGDSRAVVTQRLVLATGGHPSGRQLAQALGHHVVPPVPSLFTLRVQAPWLNALAGLSQTPVAMELIVGEERFRQQGIVLLTHWGLSGPGVLRLTAFAARALQQQRYRAELRLNWCGGVSEPVLRDQLSQARQVWPKAIGQWPPGAVDAAAAAAVAGFAAAGGFGSSAELGGTAAPR